MLQPKKKEVVITQAEKIFLNNLWKYQVLSTFSFQVPIYFGTVKKYIFDFFSLKYQTAIEIDGGHHYFGEQLKKDIQRKQRSNMSRVQILRFTNEQVINDIDNVLIEVVRQSPKKKLTAREKRWCREGKHLHSKVKLLEKIHPAYHENLLKGWLK